MSLIKKIFSGTFIDPNVREQKRQQQEELKKQREQEELKRKKEEEELRNKRKQEKMRRKQEQEEIKRRKEKEEREHLILEINKYFTVTTVNPIFILDPSVHYTLVQAFKSRCGGGTISITLREDIIPMFNEFFRDEFIVFVLMLEEKGFNFKNKEKQFVDLFVREYRYLNYQKLHEKYKKSLKYANNTEEIIFKLIDLVGFEMIYKLEYLDYISEYLLNRKFILQKATPTEIVNLINNLKGKLKAKRLEEKMSNIGNTKNKVNMSIEYVDSLTGIEFEEFVCSLLDKMGYTSKLTKQTGDQGVDILANRNGVVYAIQTKCYESTVGNTAIQEVVSGKLYYNADKSIVITNNYFTSSAKELAQKTDTFLWDRDRLIEMIKLYL